MMSATAADCAELVGAAAGVAEGAAGGAVAAAAGVGVLTLVRQSFSS